MQMSAKVQGQNKKEKGYTSCLQHCHKVRKVYWKVYWEDQNKLVDSAFVSTGVHKVINSKTEGQKGKLHEGENKI